jgi:hypothetical protein
MSLIADSGMLATLLAMADRNAVIGGLPPARLGLVATLTLRAPAMPLFDEPARAGWAWIDRGHCRQRRRGVMMAATTPHQHPHKTARGE